MHSPMFRVENFLFLIILSYLSSINTALAANNNRASRLNSVSYECKNNVFDMGCWLDKSAYYCRNNNNLKLDQSIKSIKNLLINSPIATQDKNYTINILKRLSNGLCDPLDTDTTQAENDAMPYKLWQKVNQTQHKQTQLKTSISYATNINSGSRHQFVNINDFLGNDTEIRLRLDQDNLAQSDTFNEFSLKHQRSLNTDWSLYAAYFHQKHRKYQKYNLMMFQLGIKGKFDKTQTAYDFNAKTMTLKQSHWEDSLSVSTLSPLKEYRDSRLYWENYFSYHYYIKQKSYNALDLYSGLRYQYDFSDKNNIQVKTGLQHDHALKDRPGKNRNTASLGISSQHQLAKGWELKTQLSLKKRLDTSHYNRALFADKKRDQYLGQAAISLRKPLSKQRWLSFDYALSQTQDKNIVLFDTERNEYISMGLEFNW